MKIIYSSQLPALFICICFYICTGCEQPELDNPASLVTPAIQMYEGVSADLDQKDMTAAQQNAVLVHTTQSGAIDGQYIVMFKEGTMGHETARMAGSSDRTDGSAVIDRVESMKAAFKENVLKELGQYKIPSSDVKEVICGENINGAVVKLDKTALAKLKKDPRVKHIEEDRLFSMSTIDPATRAPMIPSSWSSNQQFINYGVSKVGGSVDRTGIPYWVWIVDTGVDLDHEDLNVNATYSKNFVSSSMSSNVHGDDGHGHGTHVAGIVGAKDNSFGVVGVAAGITLVSVKVMSDTGEGTVSGLLNGLAWVETHGIRYDVVNLSLGGAVSEAIDDAIEDLSDKDIRVVIAAGNDSKNTNEVSPARVNDTGVYTISSVDFFDNFCSFSNFGSSVDYAAPGSGILSTFPNDTYGFMSGTSMSAPHASGVLMVTRSPSSSGTAGNDPFGIADPLITH
ncbi:S8 family serine peptidase [bacterium]|nr:S8 family serine peptidase [bacterium]